MKKKMDTKVIAMVGAVIVVGAAVYGVATGTVLPGTEDITQDGGNENADTPQNLNDGGNDDENDGSDSGDENDVGDGGTSEGESDGNSGGEGSNESDVGTVDVESEDEETLSHICEERESNLSDEDLRNRKIAIGPPFDPLLFESMLHDEINKLRDRRSDADPLNCDPELRDIAREHSEAVVENERINATSVRYDGVCDNPSERYGRWYYQRDMELNSPSGGSDQRVVLIANHEDLVLDVRGAWGRNQKFIRDITNSNMTRQGIGAYIDRDSREVVVTQTVCRDGDAGDTKEAE